MKDLNLKYKIWKYLDYKISKSIWKRIWSRSWGICYYNVVVKNRIWYRLRDRTESRLFSRLGDCK